MMMMMMMVVVVVVAGVQNYSRTLPPLCRLPL
jgi:hypothetical protein